jgi:hypothetical protein
MRSLVTAIFALSTLALIPVAAQAQSTEPKKDCQSAPSTTATTPPTTGPSSGSTPGNARSTGWTGGTGGSHMGTTPSGPTKGSEQDHPTTAKGLDPTKPGAGDVVAGC